LVSSFCCLCLRPPPSSTLFPYTTLFRSWVSDLALVVRPREGNIEGFVLEANSGEPLSGAELMAWELDNQGNRIAHPALSTDQNRSEEHTSELQSLRHLVCRLLLEKKNKT